MTVTSAGATAIDSFFFETLVTSTFMRSSRLRLVRSLWSMPIGRDAGDPIDELAGGTTAVVAGIVVGSRLVAGLVLAVAASNRMPNRNAVFRVVSFASMKSPVRLLGSQQISSKPKRHHG